MDTYCLVEVELMQRNWENQISAWKIYNTGSLNYSLSDKIPYFLNNVITKSHLLRQQVIISKSVVFN